MAFTGTGVTLLDGIGLNSTGKGETNTGTEKLAGVKAGVDTNIFRILKNRKEDGKYGKFGNNIVKTIPKTS